MSDQAKDRYFVITKSKSCHCCFEASVMDSHDQDPFPQPVCETFEISDAELIAKALNKNHGMGRKV